MAEVKMEDAPKKVRDFVDKGMSAMERSNLDYAMDMFIMALDEEPGLLKARHLLRAASVQAYKNNNPGKIFHQVSLLKGMGGLIKTYSLLKKNPQESLKQAELLMRDDPFNLTFVKMLTQAAVACELPEVAIQTLEIIKEHSGELKQKVAVLNQLTGLYKKLGDTAQAMEYAQEVVNLCPNDGKALKRYKDISALNTMNRGGWNQAKSYRDVMKDKEEAQLLEQENANVKADANIENLIHNTRDKINKEPENINYRRALADLYVRAKDFEKALDSLKEAQRLSGGADPQIDRSYTEVMLKKYEHEIKQLESLGDKEGIAAKKREMENFRVENAEDKVKRYPNDLNFKYDYGLLLYEREKYNEAIQQFQLSQRSPQRRIRSLYYLGLCFKAKGQFDIAREQLEKAASELHMMDDTKMEIVYELGVICDATGKTDKAIEFYKEIYSVDIGFRDVAQKIEQAYSKD